MNDPQPGKEISWQEFRNQLLESGQVERIVVTNKNMAKVVMRRGTSGDAAGDSGAAGESGGRGGVVDGGIGLRRVQKQT